MTQTTGKPKEPQPYWQLITYDLHGNRNHGFEVNDLYETGIYIPANKISHAKMLRFLHYYFNIQRFKKQHCPHTEKNTIEVGVTKLENSKKPLYTYWKERDEET